MFQETALYLVVCPFGLITYKIQATEVNGPSSPLQSSQSLGLEATDAFSALRVRAFIFASALGTCSAEVLLA